MLGELGSRRDTASVRHDPLHKRFGGEVIGVGLERRYGYGGHTFGKGVACEAGGVLGQGQIR
eukprot:6725854-Prymnesium_polylepis.1